MLRRENLFSILTCQLPRTRVLRQKSRETRDESLHTENTNSSLHHQYGKQKTFQPRLLIRRKKGVMSRCHTNTVIGLCTGQQVTVLKKIQERSATSQTHAKIADPKSYQRQYRHPGTVPVILHHLQHGNLHYLQVCPQNLLLHSETLTCSRPHLYVLETRLVVGVLSGSHPTKAIAMAQHGAQHLGVTEVKITTEKGTDGARLPNIGGHHFWLEFRQTSRLEKI